MRSHGDHARIQVAGLDVTVVRRRIRGLYLGVRPPDASVVVSAPLRTSDRTVRRAVLDGMAWIERHRARILEEEQRAPTPRPWLPSATDGATWWHLGDPYRLEVRDTAAARIAVRVATDEGRIVLAAAPTHPPAARMAALEAWQRRALRAAASELIAVWSQRLEVSAEFLGIRRMRTQWGSCVPSRRRIWLNLELVTRPLPLVEYVVVHELAHLIEASHGPRFRAVLDAHLPDWQDRRDRLETPWPPAHLAAPVQLDLPLDLRPDLRPDLPQPQVLSSPRSASPGPLVGPLRRSVDS